MAAAKNYISDLFVSTRFYVVMGTAVFIFLMAFFISEFLGVARYFFIVAAALVFIDYFFMFFVNKTPAVNAK